MKMGKSAYIKLVEGSTQQDITLDQVKELLNMYQERTEKTGEQLSWEYHEAAFPYTVEERTNDSTKYLYLKGKDEKYNYLIIGVDSEEEGTNKYIQIVLPDEDHLTPGDLAKGNELAKYFGRYLKAELHLFNDRIMYFNPRK